MTADGDGPVRDADAGDEAGRNSGGTPRGPPTVSELAASLTAAVRSRPPAELALVFLPLPALLVAVSLLPGSSAWRLSLAAEGVFESRWTLWTAFASSYVHTTTTHLVDNVVNYWLLLAVAYPLSVVAGWRRRLLYAALTYLSVVPIVSAWATIVALGGLTNAPTAGFSDVNSAFLGYLVVVWFAALATETNGSGAVDRSPDGGLVGIDARWAAVVALASLAVAYLVPSGAGYFPPLPAVGGLFAVAAVAVAAGLHAVAGRPRVVGLNLAPSRELLYVTGASVAAAGVIGSMVLVPFGSNVFAHLAGYVVGFIVPFLAVIADESSAAGSG
ncbi:hypothetical protein C461_08464 [Halorubrum aidingense JCM 13560]|uniref:Rhomboid family protein n=1 Tax=Halorubrum aidingense JCM 13560 TaxID=1230454 RepID=M0PCH6_9EURY|nr:hypothetical protein [Halorubrum aidingense]EMA67746.1 hypothetical protein C461_08464 [Halorubrum aidingense JCM 13560]